MKKIIFSLIIAILFFSCEKYPEPGSETVESLYFSLYGNFQISEAGTYLTEKVGAQIDLNSVIPKTDQKYRMEIEITAGGGSVDQEIIQSDPEGRMLTNWQLGNDINLQELTCRIFDFENNLLSEFTIESTAIFTDDWNKITNGLLVGIDDMICDTTRQRTMMYNHGGIWILKDNFYSWEPRGFPFNTYLRFIEMTSDGTVFAAGWNGELYKTEDWGENWQYVCNPLPGNPYYYNFNITSDDYLWASKDSYGVYCSKDKGMTWIRDTTERVLNTTLGPIYKYQNSYLALAGNPLSIIQKSADSLNWEDINTPEYSLSMFVPNDSIIIAQNQGGFRLHKSTDNGETYKPVFTPNVSMGGGNLWHIYNRFGNNYYVFAPSSGVWRTYNFEEFEQLIDIRTHQSKLFIDHTGTIYAAGSNFINAEDEATYILPGNH